MACLSHPKGTVDLLAFEAGVRPYTAPLNHHLVYEDSQWWSGAACIVKEGSQQTVCGHHTVSTRTKILPEAFHCQVCGICKANVGRNP